MVEQSNTIIEELHGTQEAIGKKERKLKGFLTYLSLVLSIAAFFLSLFPQINPLNANYTQKAEAGDVEAQMFLAEHYYEVGENKDSHYWYKIASMYYGNHQGAALNNVACIGLTYGYYNDSLQDYQSKALSMFKKAAVLGDKAAVQNMYTLLKEMGQDTTTADFEMELAWAIQVSYRFGVHIEGLSESEIKWALEQFHLNEHTAYVGADYGVYYDGIGIYPEDTAFVEKDIIYNSYIYQPK